MSVVTTSDGSYVPHDLLRRLVELRLYSVQFVTDYVQLRFDGAVDDQPVLTCDVLPTVERAGSTLTPGQLGYADALQALIPQHVTATTESTGSGLRIDFEDGAVVLHPDRDELDGPEIALLQGFSDGRWMYWRPGEDSFEDLA